MPTPRTRPIPNYKRREARFDNTVLKLNPGNAVIVRVVKERGFGFLRGDNEDHDTFFHANCVRYTEHELARKKRERLPIGDAFDELEVGMKVLYLSAAMDKEGKGPRARWIGVGEQGDQGKGNR